MNLQLQQDNNKKLGPRFNLGPNFLNNKFSIFFNPHARIKIERYHFFIFSTLFHLSIIVPIFFELFQNQIIIKETQTEQIVYINFEQKTEVPHAKHEKDLHEAPKTITKNKQEQYQQKKEVKKLSKSQIKDMTKKYEDKISHAIAVVLEKHIDEHENLQGEFVVELKVERNGIVKGMRLIQETDDEKNNYEFLDILKELGKFDPIPKAFPEMREYKFHVPVYIE
ncbi:MAG: hypothetical protein J0H68_05005 [Sphingobacteriia bacterium]|nr:hypothetical protein [Sphingobacteriia bacterium]